MATGRAARHADARRIKAILGRIRPQPAHGGLRVVDGGGELVSGCKPVADGRGHEAALRQRKTKFVVAFARAGAETTAVDAQHGGERAACVLWSGQVELHPPAACFGIGDVAFEGDVVRHGKFGGVRCEGETKQQEGERDEVTIHDASQLVNAE